jgi:hypothetical protein
MTQTTAIAGLLGALVLSCPACGTSRGAREESGFAASTGGASAGPSGTGTGGLEAGAGPDLGGLIGRGTDAGQPAECTATYSGEAKFEPVRLAFAFDVSASMGQLDKPYHDPKLKWEPVVAATTGFFEDPASTGISASLRFFPIDAGDTKRCDEKSYETPDVPMTALPSDVFRQAIDAVTPKTSSDWLSGTPTLAVVEGTIAFVKPLVASETDSRHAIVLVTDGYPQGCDDNAISSVADAVAAVASEIPTYVIGVSNPPGGPDTVSNLNEVAASGRTDHAFVISTGDPERTKEDFRTAVTGIRTQALSCDFAIPSLPEGQTFDPNAANVAYTVGTERIDLGYDAGCTSDRAWRYDDPAAPTRMELCDGTCDAVKALPGVALTVDFGCRRRTAIH